MIRKGFYFRKSDSRKIARFQCLSCKRTFSQASYSDCIHQKKRRLNPRIETLLAGSSNLNLLARQLQVSRNTVVQKFLFLGKKAEQGNADFVKNYASKYPITQVQFDEMETFEVSKCLPLSIPLVVETGTNLILGYRVCSMPAKGLLAAISRKKYGSRVDDRPKSACDLFQDLKPVLNPHLEIRSDENPKYPSWIRPHFPAATHLRYKGRRARVIGQGELKEGGFDPLFSLNHSAAMLRAHVSRLFRRSWNTTKKRERLALHLAIYVQAHNQRVLSKLHHKGE